MQKSDSLFLPEKILDHISFFAGATVYLYGSYLTGTFHSQSDIDLLVLTDKIRTEKELFQWKTGLAPLKISVIQMSERSFNLNRHQGYYFAPQLEEIGRHGQLVRGNTKIGPAMTDEDFTYSTWLTALFELSQFKFTTNEEYKLKVLARGTMVAWELERAWSFKGSYSLGIAAHRLMRGELEIPTNDLLADFLTESNILWKWLDFSIKSVNNEALIEEWARELKNRLGAYSKILNTIKFPPLTQEGLSHLQGHSLYANIPWLAEDRLMVMGDLGRQFIINFVKICLSNNK